MGTVFFHTADKRQAFLLIYNNFSHHESNNFLELWLLHLACLAVLQEVWSELAKVNGFSSFLRLGFHLLRARAPKVKLTLGRTCAKLAIVQTISHQPVACLLSARCLELLLLIKYNVWTT